MMLDLDKEEMESDANVAPIRDKRDFEKDENGLTYHFFVLLNLGWIFSCNDHRPKISL